MNGAYRGDDDIGRLMHDFSCSDPDDMLDSDMAEVTRYYKENEKGVEAVCKVMDEMREDTRLRHSREIAFRLLSLGEDTFEKIAKVTELSVEEVKQIAEHEFA